MAEVVLEQVSRIYPGDVLAVDSLSLRVADRELLVLVGPSGCGKSTVLRMIAGLEEISSGEIRIGGKRVNETPPRHRDIAMVFQNYALYPHMTVARNMAFGLELRYGGAWPTRLARRLLRPARGAEWTQKWQAIPSRVRQVAQSLGIEHLLKRMPRELSGGERQRVALGRAIVREPAAFLFDEPLSNLDARLRTDTRRELKALHSRLQATMIYVTHDQVEALTLGDRIAVLEGGVLQQAGTPEEVYHLPRNRFVASFVGTPAMNFVEGELETIKGELTFHGRGILQPLAKTDAARFFHGRKGPVTLGVRPEHVQISARGEMPEEMPARVTMKVTMVEPLGDATLVHLEAGATKLALTSKVPAETVVHTGEEVRLRLDPLRLHLFDHATGENLAIG